MKVTMIACTNDEHGQHVPNEIVELPEDAALDYIARGLAIAHKAPVVERAVVSAKEHATGPGQGARSFAPTPPKFVGEEHAAKAEKTRDDK